MDRLFGFLALLLLLSKSAMAAPSCTTVVQELIPCLGFLQGGNDQPSMACCSGVKDIAKSVKSKADRSAICECLKKALSKVPYKPPRIPLLPKKCGVSVALPPIDQNTDCSKALFYHAG